MTAIRVWNPKFRQTSSNEFVAKIAAPDRTPTCTGYGSPTKRVRMEARRTREKQHGRSPRRSVDKCLLMEAAPDWTPTCTGYGSPTKRVRMEARRTREKQHGRSPRRSVDKCRLMEATKHGGFLPASRGWSKRAAGDERNVRSRRTSLYCLTLCEFVTSCFYP